MMAAHAGTYGAGRAKKAKKKAGFLARIRRPFWWLAWIACAVLLLFLFKEWALNTGFKVKKVYFEGASIVPEKQLLEIANIRASDVTFGLDTEAMEKRILELPIIKTCSVRVSMPSAVIIKVEERVPLASVMANNRIYEIDYEGKVLREVPPLAPPNGPLITNLPGVGPLTPGQTLENSTLLRALELWNAFSAAPVAAQLTLSEISAEQDNLLVMIFDQLPFETRWGRADFPSQVRRFEALWREKQGNLSCAEYLDMRFDDTLACK